MTSSPLSSLRTPQFRRYFSGVGISAFGTTITAVALPVLVVDVLHAEPVGVGLVNAAQLLPYALLGLVAGVYVDRWRRQRVLVWASIGRAVSLALVPLLWWTGLLQLWVLVVLLLAFGVFSVFGFAATQSLLPQIVERRALLAANARLDQVDAAAQTAGPAFGGWIVALVGAPVSLAIDAITYVADAVLVAGAKIAVPDDGRRVRRSLAKEIGEGLRWTYRHAVLAPLAWSTHVWFFANAAAFTVLAVLALRGLGLSAFAFGLLLAAAGAATLGGASLASRLGARFAPGAIIVWARAVYPVAWAAIALTPVLSGEATTLGVLFAAFALQGLAGGIENANEMSLRQTVTPDALLGRVSATMRSMNRTVAAVGAVVGGLAATVFGVLPTLIGVSVVFVIAFVIALVSPLRSAKLVVSAG